MTTSTLFNLGTDIQGMIANSLQFCVNNFSANLMVATNSEIIVPSNFKIWIAVFSFEAGKKIWVSVNSVAQTPSSFLFSSTNSQLLDINSRRTVFAGDTINVITSNVTAEIGISLYAIS